MDKNIVIGEEAKTYQTYSGAPIALRDADGENYVLSQNSQQYFVHNCLGGHSLTIYKDAPEGQTISEMLQRKEAFCVFRDYFAEILVQHLDPLALVHLAYYEYHKGYKQGLLDKVNEIRDALRLKPTTSRD